MYVSCLGSSLCDELITRLEESYRVCVCVCVCVCVWCVCVCECVWCVCVCVCVRARPIVCDRETSTMKRPEPDCAVTCSTTSHARH